MLHKRHYTLEQAHAAMPWVADRVGWVRDAHARLVALGSRAREAIAALDVRAGGSYPDREVARALVQLSRTVGELEAVDIVLRDFKRGLVDFPALRPGASQAGSPALERPENVEIYLCWLVDEEDTIGFWHEPGAGFPGRRPL